MPDKTEPDEQKTERFNLFMSPSEMKAIDEWAWENRVRSKSEAVRRLLQIGIQSDQRIADMLVKAERALAFSLLAGERCTDLYEKDQEAWEKIAKYAVGALSENIEIQSLLVSTLASLANQSAALKSQGEVSQLLEKAEKIRQAEIFQNQELEKAFSGAVGDDE